MRTSDLGDSTVCDVIKYFWHNFNVILFSLDNTPTATDGNGQAWYNINRTYRFREVNNIASFL